MYHISPKTTCWLILIAVVLLSAPPSQGQVTPQVDLLKLGSSKPNLSATGEGITSYKIVDLFQEGVTEIVPGDRSQKIDLPVGYTLFNNLAYVVKSSAVVSGPNDVEFHIPSANTMQSFDRLRVLWADVDFVEPEKVTWVDCTVTTVPDELQKLFLSGIELSERLPNFKKRTIHAFLEGRPKLLVVAIKDPNIARDRFSANLKITGMDSQSLEGRRIIYTLRVSNLGPDDATNITLDQGNWIGANSFTISFERISVTPTAGKCRSAGGNLHCKFPRLEKDKTIEVKIVDRCPWISEKEDTRESRKFNNQVTVYGAEQDPFVEDNQVVITTTVIPDSNKHPEVDIVSPGPSQMFQGPKANVPIRVTATDPDGVVSKVEFFEDEKPIGVGTLVGSSEYELMYKDVPFGLHHVEVKVTDNLGRDFKTKLLPFMVNGLAELQIISPAAGAKLNKSDDIMVTIRARNPTSPLKRVSLEFWDSDASPIGNDLYSVKLRSCGRVCRLRAIAVDAERIETISEVVEFVIAEAPNVELLWADGEYSKPVENDQKFRVSELILRAVANRGYPAWKLKTSAKIVKVEVFANGELVWSEASDESEVMSEFRWQNIQSGRYKLQVVATDEDGAVGRSPVKEVTIERP